MELRRRNGLHLALANRDEITLGPLVNFILRFMTDYRYTSLLCSIAEILFGMCFSSCFGPLLKCRCRKIHTFDWPISWAGCTIQAVACQSAGGSQAAARVPTGQRHARNALCPERSFQAGSECMNEKWSAFSKLRRSLLDVLGSLSG